MASKDLIEVKFRLIDGTDIGPSKYSPTASVASLKEKIISQWPKDKEISPRTINDLKLINAGKILENNRTLAESRLPVELPGGVITMHVVVRPPLLDKNTDNYIKNMMKDNSVVSSETVLILAFSVDKVQNDSPKSMNRCTCSIL